MADNESILALVEEKHRKEEENLKIEIRALLKSAKKGKKAQVEAQAIQMEYDLRAKHMQELEDFEENGVVDGSLMSESATNAREEKDEDNISDVAETIPLSVGMSKKEKSRRKKERKQAKEVEREVIKMQLKALSGPDIREIETSKMNQLLSVESLQVKEIDADGNCLYRSLSDQLKRVMKLAAASRAVLETEEPLNHVTLRKLAAEHIRANADQFAPFIGVESGSNEFEDYCRQVEDSVRAVWGGQLEVSALSARLQMPVWVYEVDKPILKMGEEFESDVCAPLKITYHRHYYSLGEHYNSVIDVTSS